MSLFTVMKKWWFALPAVLIVAFLSLRFAGTKNTEIKAKGYAHLARNPFLFVFTLGVQGMAGRDQPSVEQIALPVRGRDADQVAHQPPPTSRPAGLRCMEERLMTLGIPPLSTNFTLGRRAPHPSSMPASYRP